MTVAVVVALCTFIHRKPALLGVEPGSSQQMYWMAGVIAAGVVFLIIMGVYHLLNRHAAVQSFELRRQLAAGDDYRAVTTKKADRRHPAMVELAAFLRDRYGPFWRRKIRLLLVTGEPEQAEAIAPGLTGQHWLEGDHTVLIYGGRPSAEPDVTLLAALKKLRRSRPLDGIIWPLTEEQSRQTAQLDKGWRELVNGSKRLGFQAPLYLWQV
ncbi:TPA: type VI secretion protein VasK, partial [Escherichia coli]|nr:type VI secretion protein VasK [Escherichia coli]